jgi:hypothetical protein
MNNTSNTCTLMTADEKQQASVKNHVDTGAKGNLPS